jgi:uncharacterized repeat protein (TIGR03847 family)
MAGQRFVFDLPDRFVAGTVGEPGQRTFFLQARDGGRVVSVALEKIQVAVLAERMAELLEELERRGLTGELLGQASAAPDDVEPLDEPLREAFRAGSLTLGWDGDVERVLVEARSELEGDDEDDEPATVDAQAAADLLRVQLSPEAARGFVERAVRVVASGRPPCPLCGQPLDPQGHLCPRRNGQYVN